MRDVQWTMKSYRARGAAPTGERVFVGAAPCARCPVDHEGLSRAGRSSYKGDGCLWEQHPVRDFQWDMKAYRAQGAAPTG